MIKVNGVEYDCYYEMNRIAEAVRLNNDYEGEVGHLAFRNLLEVNGERYVLIRILPFEKRNVFVISVPNNVETLCDRCFYGCVSLCQILFESDSKLNEIGGLSFYGSGIKAIRIPSNVENIGNCSFCWCKSLCDIIFESNSKPIEGNW
jgi:hypothetical protein